MRAYIAAGLLLIGACGGGDDEAEAPPADVPTCVDLYAEGAQTDDIVEHNDRPLEENGCVTAEGDWEAYGLLFFDCEDGERVVHYNQFGWGIDGDVWHHYAGTETAPAADVC